MRPFVSILMTSYNREKYIAEAIQSVLMANYDNFELIIVDDCSTDLTVDIARTYEAKDKRVRVIQNEKNLGQFKNRNKAASYAKGDYIKYFDSDDVMFPDCLDVMIGAMEKYPEAGAGAVKPGKRDAPIQYLPGENYINHFFKGNSILYIGPSGCIIKKEVFNEFDGFDENIGILADTLLMLKIAAKYNIVAFRDGILHWRVHEEQVITIGQRNWFNMQKELYEVNDIVLTSPHVPLSPPEVKIIKRNMRNILIRNMVKRLLLKWNLREYRMLSGMFKLGIRDYFQAIFKNKKLA